MRKLMWFALGFGASCAFCAYLLAGDVLPVLAAGFFAGAVILWLLCRRLERKPVAALALLGIAVGLLWFWVYDGGYLQTIRELDGVTTKASIEITDFSYETDYGIAADGRSTWGGKEVRIRVYLNEKDAVLNPGDTVTGSFRFRITDVGGAKEATYHRGRGIALIAYQRGEVTIDRADTPWWYYPAAHIRSNILGLLDALFPADTAAFAKALLLGEDSGLDYETNTSFKVTGIRHIIAVSGLHVSILFSFILVMTGRRPVLTALLGLPQLVLFAMVAGLTPSVVRACVMNGLVMLATLFRKDYDNFTSLSFAALVMLAVNPLVITDIGFQLSFACMAGIFLFAEDMKCWLLDDKRLGNAKGKTLKARLVRWFAGSVSVSLSAMVLTAPLTALHFGCVSLVSILANLLVLWATTYAFYGIMAVCILGLLWQPLAVGAAWLVSWLVRYILGVCDLLALFPLAAAYTKSEYVVWWIGLCYVLLGLFFLIQRRYPVIFSCLGVLSLCGCLLFSWIQPTFDQVRITVLDVGQGQSIMLQSEGRTFLVDCGGSYADDAADAAAETLLSMGISRIDGLILTHYDDDHAGAVELLLTRIQADNLFFPPWEDEKGLDARLEGHHVTQIQELTYGSSKMTLIPSQIEGEGNESSLCILFQAADCDILITGDLGSLGEKLLLRQFPLPELDILVAGHHGSKYSTSQELLEATRPRAVAISVDKNNSYGHPAGEMLARLEKYGCAVFRTDRDGTIIFRR